MSVRTFRCRPKKGLEKIKGPFTPFNLSHDNARSIRITKPLKRKEVGRYFGEFRTLAAICGVLLSSLLRDEVCLPKTTRVIKESV